MSDKNFNNLLSDMGQYFSFPQNPTLVTMALHSGNFKNYDQKNILIQTKMLITASKNNEHTIFNINFNWMETYLNGKESIYYPC